MALTINDHLNMNNNGVNLTTKETMPMLSTDTIIDILQNTMAKPMEVKTLHADDIKEEYWAALVTGTNIVIAHRPNAKNSDLITGPLAPKKFGKIGACLGVKVVGDYIVTMACITMSAKKRGKPVETNITFVFKDNVMWIIHSTKPFDGMEWMRDEKLKPVYAKYFEYLRMQIAISMIPPFMRGGVWSDNGRSDKLSYTVFLPQLEKKE